MPAFTFSVVLKKKSSGDCKKKKLHYTTDWCFHDFLYIAAIYSVPFNAAEAEQACP